MSIKLNPDENVVKAIRNRLKITEGQCPCVSEDEWSIDTVCPCRKFREEKVCCCNLYVNTEEECNHR